MHCAAPPVEPTTSIDVHDVLSKLQSACPGPLQCTQRRDLDAICRKIGVTGGLLDHYESDWKPPSEKAPLPIDHWPLVASVLLEWSDALAVSDRPYALKLLNAACSAVDIGQISGALRDTITCRVDRLAIPAAAQGTSFSTTGVQPSPRTLPLTVLAYEGPCARAYLAMMRRAGLRPQRIVLLALVEHPQSHKAVGRWFPGRLRTWYAEKTQDVAMNHWPRRIRSRHPELLRAIVDGLQPVLHQPGELIREMYDAFSYDAYADVVERVAAPGLRSDAVHDALRACSPSSILFTGGGILPARTIDLPGLKFLHVHPGHLPHVRGADGMLWSMLMRGQPSMSCFHLAGGLDTGDLVAVHDYPRLSFALPHAHRPDDQTLYRALFGFADPLLRADLLVNQVLAETTDPATWPTTRQDVETGVTCHFMHPLLRRRALEALFLPS